MESVRGIENPGMMGEMGKIIGFYRLYRQTAEEEWEEKAEVLLDEVMENCSLELPATYGDGLCGVGVGIEYLLQEGFVDDNANLSCQIHTASLPDVIMPFSQYSISFSTFALNTSNRCNKQRIKNTSSKSELSLTPGSESAIQSIR